MTTTYTPGLTPEEYLVRERAAKYKSEYVDGQVRARSGATREHVLVTTNITTSLVTQLRGRPCETYGSDLRVKVPRGTSYVYPDVAVVCGEPRLEDEHFDTLLDPTVIVEVLSPSTAGYDRGEKWEMYRRIPSLRDYLLVSQDRPRIERYARQEEGPWLFSETNGLDAVLQIDSVACTLALRDVYERVLQGARRP